MNFKKLLPSFTANEIDLLSKTGIYSIVNTVRGKFYIGSASRVDLNKPSACGFYARWYEHVNDLNNNTHGSEYLQRSWNKYGAKAFKFQILEFVEPEKCIEVEQTYLDLFPEGDRDLVYNTCFIAGGAFNLGRKCSEETKKKRSISRARSFKVVSPEGLVIEGINLKKFCADNSLGFPTMSKITNGKAFHHKGWTATIEAHELYKKAYETRGLTYRAARGTNREAWILYWKGNNKFFLDKEEAIAYRDRLVNEGYNFTVCVFNWKEKLNAKENS
jgi:group I intron endonuclease